MGAFTLIRGDTLLLDVQVKKNGVPVDITGWKVWFTVKRNFPDADNNAVYQANSTDGSGDVTITSSTQGKVTVRMPALKTFAFPDGMTKLIYDVQTKDASGVTATVDVGTVTVSPDVTRALT